MVMNLLSACSTQSVGNVCYDEISLLLKSYSDLSARHQELFLSFASSLLHENRDMNVSELAQVLASDKEQIIR